MDVWLADGDSLMSVLDLVMISYVQLQCVSSYTVLAYPEVEPHAINT